MKGSLIVIVFFCVGCIMGVFNKFQFDTHTVSMYILYALMLQVGISIGSNKNLKAIISHLHPKMLLIPLGTITGTLLFSALASILLSQWSVFDCMAVGSGFAYYSHCPSIPHYLNTISQSFRDLLQTANSAPSLTLVSA